MSIPKPCVTWGFIILTVNYIGTIQKLKQINSKNVYYNLDISILELLGGVYA